MASDNEASCESDPNFAVICAFMEKFGTTCGLQSIDFLELQEMLENTQEVPQELIDLHIKLLRKSRKTVSNERWEKAIIKFCHTFCVQDAWEIERFGYKKARLSSKLRVLKELLEMQFDFNARFKAEVNKMSAEELRSQPLGKDKQGHAYWFQNDNNCQIRVYKEDPDEETWTLVAKDREGLVSLISELSDGDSKISSESAINEEDSNSLAEKPIIDTGQVDSSSDSNKKMSGDSENSNESKESTKKEDNISPQEDPDGQTDDEEEKHSTEVETIPAKRPRESDDETGESKKPKIEESEEKVVGEAIEEPVMLVKGSGSGEGNQCVNPIVGEEIEEDLMFFFGEGNGVDCQTGNEDKNSDAQTNDSSESGVSKSDGRDASDSDLVSISDSKNCVNDEVPTSPVKSPYKLGTIIDTKTDNKFFSTVKSPTKKSRWDVETIMAKGAPEPGRVKELVNKWEQINEEEKEEPPKKSLFFFGPGCLQFNPATVGFGQKVPPESENENLEVSPDKAKGDVGYRIGEKEETSECVQSGADAGPLVNEVDHETPIETRIDTLEEKVTPASDNKDSLEQTKVEEEAKGCTTPVKEEKTVPVAEEPCVKKHAYICGKDSPKEVVENHNPEQEIVIAKEEEGGKRDENIDENENKHMIEESIEEKEEVDLESESEIPGLVKLQEEEKRVEKHEDVKETEKLEDVKETEKLDDIQSVGPEEIKEEIKEVERTEVKLKGDDKLVELDQEEVNKPEEIKQVGQPEQVKEIEKAEQVKKVEKPKESTKIESTANPDLKINQNIEAVKNKAEEKSSENVGPAEEAVTVENKKAPDKPSVLVKEPVVILTNDILVEERSLNKEETAAVPAKRGRKNNSSDQSAEDEKKPRVTRRTRSSKNEETANEGPALPTRRGRPRANQKAKEEKSETDSNKKMKMSNEVNSPGETTEPTANVEKENQEKAAEDSTKKVEKKRPRGRPRNDETSKEITQPETEEIPSSPASGHSANATETVVVESSSSNDVVEVPDKDPLAASEEEIKAKSDKPMSLSTFSLDFNESPTPTPPVTRSGLRKRGRESPQNSEDTEETGGKRQKVKAKRTVDIKLRKSIEEQKKKELISSDDDSKNEQPDEKKTLGKNPEEESKNDESIVVSSDAEKETEKKKKKERKSKNRRLLTSLGIDPDKALDFNAEQTVGVRQSRRIAQLKIKEEAERRKLEEDIGHEVKKKKKSKKSEDKDYKADKRRPKNECDEEEAAEDDSADSKKRKKKKKKHRKFDEFNPWRSSSDSSSSDDEDEMGEEEEEEEDVLQYVSDHEFSPESDMEGDGEALPLKRARTARKESDVEEVDDCPCQKCGKSDHPEWILLCDSCDNGWHCSCLRPPLLVIPEGDWFCPPCQHSSLLNKLQEKLKEYDKKLNKKEIEDRRKQRLAYVGISLNSVLPTKDTENIKKRRHFTREEDEDDAEENDEDGDRYDDLGGEYGSSEESESASPTASESGSDSDEPIYQLRQRRQAHSYRFNDYDELINSAIQDELDAVKGAGNQGRGKDIATIVNAEKEEEKKKETEVEGEEAAGELEPLPPVVPLNDKDKEAKPIFEDSSVPGIKKKLVGRKKHRKLNALDISSADDDEDSDEDFKGTSSESDEDFEEDLGSDDSDDLDSPRNRRKGSDPVRRSTRARTSRYDADFIDDGDSDSEDDAPRRKKKRSIWDESESEESDKSWGRRRRKPTQSRSRKSTTSTTKKKKSKKKKKQVDSDEEVYKKKKPKIKFGLDGEDDGPVRRTRGKKINYVDALGSDSDEDRVKRPPPRIESDEEYVADEDKASEEEVESGDENATQKASKIQIQSYTDARFTQLLPEPKNQIHDDVDGELNPIDQINRNVEMMDENEMEKMMEEEEYANKQLQMVAQQLEKEKRRKEREAKKLEGVLNQPIGQLAQQDPKKRPVNNKPKDKFQFSGSMQEPLVGNVDNLIVNSENNDELSEPPGVSLPLFAELGVSSENSEDLSKKRRVRNKKSLEEAVANLGSGRQHEAPAFMQLGNKATDLSIPQDSNIEIAAPPQPFSHSQPTPSVITRMLQNKPGQPGYPVGTIRPKQFATMPHEDDAMASSPGHPSQYIQGTTAIRPQLSTAFRQMAPNMNHYPRNAPPQIRNPVPHIYHSHRPMDPSPSGGGTITIAEHNSPGRVVSPASSSPGSNKNETPPPPYSRPPSGGARFPMVSTTGAGPRHIQMVPPPHLQPPRPNLSPYHPGMPPQYHYAQFSQEDALPPTMYQNSSYSEPFEGQVNPSENSNSKSFEEESGGEFGGLVSYFSSQREDDLES